MSTKVSAIKVYTNGTWQDISKVHDGSGWKNFRGIYSDGTWYELSTVTPTTLYDSSMAWFQSTESTWSATRDATSADTYAGGTSLQVQNNLYDTGAGNDYMIKRTIFKLDTSSISGADGYTSATMNLHIELEPTHNNKVYIQKHTNFDGSTGDYGAYDRSLFTTDYGNGTPDSSGYININLNSSFLVDASNNNELNIGVRNSLDYENTAPTAVETSRVSNDDSVVSVDFS